MAAMKREIATEARRIARNLIKKELKRNKVDLSQVPASSITKAVSELLVEQPNIFDEARRNMQKLERETHDIS
jgi:hypothetical protein